MIFEELDYRETPLGAISLRRRTEPRINDELVYEVKLDDEFLMSSLFTVGERALATKALARLNGPALNVVVGGLGLGYTARAALEDARVAELLVIDALGEVIEWHRRGLVPLGPELSGDPRCRLVCGDFFALAARPESGFDPDATGRRFDAVLLDIDHSPEHWLAPAHQRFYSDEGLRQLAAQLRSGGVFAMWSNDRPDTEFEAMLAKVLTDVYAELVTFPNPYTGEDAFCSVYSGLAP